MGPGRCPVWSYLIVPSCQCPWAETAREVPADSPAGEVRAPNKEPDPEVQGQAQIPMTLVTQASRKGRQPIPRALWPVPCTLLGDKHSSCQPHPESHSTWTKVVARGTRMMHHPYREGRVLGVHDSERPHPSVTGPLGRVRSTHLHPSARPWCGPHPWEGQYFQFSVPVTSTPSCCCPQTRNPRPRWSSWHTRVTGIIISTSVPPVSRFQLRPLACFWILEKGIF